MNKQIVVVLVAALGLSIFLYSRPKFVVKDKEKEETKETTAKEPANKSDINDNHAVSLTKEQKEAVSGFYKELQTAKTVETQVPIWEKLAEVYTRASVADSAGYYFEKIAAAQPTADHWLRAGDLYFQAYNLALQTQNVTKYAEKVRTCYQNALEKSPNNLHARTNLAMTYVASDSPMKAIAALREVLDLDPNYEPALMNMGVLSLQSNQYDKAVGRFRQVLAKNPENVNAQLGLAYSLIETGKKQEAIELLKKLEKKNLDEVLRQEVQNTLQSIK